MKITHPKDFYAGLMFFAFGLFAMVMALQYPLGTAARMGPGYFPRVLGAILSIRSFREHGGAISPFAWKAVALVLGGVCLFGAIVLTVGLVAATVALIFVTGYASTEFNVKESIISSVILSVISVGLFIVGLKLQFPIFPWGM
jgi:hypothetical protein